MASIEEIKECILQCPEFWNDFADEGLDVFNEKDAKLTRNNIGSQISEIINVSKEESICLHCGEGIRTEAMFTLNDGKIGTVDYYSGCMSEGEEGTVGIFRDMDAAKRFIDQ